MLHEVVLNTPGRDGSFEASIEKLLSGRQEQPRKVRGMDQMQKCPTPIGIGHFRGNDMEQKIFQAPQTATAWQSPADAQADGNSITGKASSRFSR